MKKVNQYVPIGWSIKKIGDILSIGSGKDYKHLEHGEIPVFGTGGYMASVNKFLHDGETVCIGRKGTIDSPMYYKGKIWTVDTLFYTHSFKNSIPVYVFNLFLSIKWKDYNEASGVPSLSKTIIEKIEVLIPPLPEQQKIAQVLNTWDEAIQTTQNLIKMLEIRKKGLMQRLMSGKTRLNGFSEKWTRGKIEDVTTNFSRRNKKIVDAPVYSVTNSNGFVLQSEHFSRGIAGDDLSNYKIIKKNEFAYNPARINVGSIAFFEDEIGVISSLYVCFSTNEKMIDYYLQELLKLDYTKHQIENLGEGGVRVYLWYDLFSKIKITIPPIEEQKAIIQILKTADAELNETKAYLETLKQQKKGLMQQLLTGKIRVK